MATTTFQHGAEQRFEASQRARYNGTDGVIWIERRKAADGGWMHWGKQHLPLRATRKQVVEQFGCIYRAEQVTA
jgi:hypothetical protein